MPNKYQIILESEEEFSDQEITQHIERIIKHDTMAKSLGKPEFKVVEAINLEGIRQKHKWFNEICIYCSASIYFPNSIYCED